MPLLSLVVSTIFAIQALGLYWVGQGCRWGSILQLLVGLFWPIASGMAQLPVILSGAPYRAGAISILYVGGMIVVGLLLFFSAIRALTQRN